MKFGELLKSCKRKYNRCIRVNNVNYLEIKRKLSNHIIKGWRRTVNFLVARNCLKVRGMFFVSQ